MKYLISTVVLAIALTNIGCPDKGSQPASIVSSPNTQCLSSIPTGPNGTVGGYAYPYNQSCNYGYGYNSYFSPYRYYNYGWGNGFMCGAGYIAAYSNGLGLACMPTTGLPTASLMYYSWMNNNWSSSYGYLNYWSYPTMWGSNYAAVSCVSSYPGCNCVPVGNGYGGIGLCTR